MHKKIAEAEDHCDLPLLEGEYNVSFHIASIFILAGVSLIGASLPIVGKSFFKASPILEMQQIINIF